LTFETVAEKLLSAKAEVAQVWSGVNGLRLPEKVVAEASDSDDEDEDDSDDSDVGPSRF